MRSFVRLLRLLPVALLALAPVRAAADTCTDMVSAKVAGATVTAATDVPAGLFTTPAQIGLPSTSFTVPAFCRVQVTIKPRILTEVWLPVAWNGSFVGVGNGGEFGAIIYTELGGSIDEGFAAAGSNLGHEGNTVDASWALNKPNLVKEFGYTATHDMTVVAKSVIQIYYGTAQAHSYFYGASAGGRQGLMEAQNYPTDYNGIVSLSPAQGWTHITSGMISQELILGGSPTSPEQLTSDQATALNAAVVAACDGLDGLVDGLITDPTKCVFDPGTLQCNPKATTTNCLTDVQVAAVRQLYLPLTNSGGQVVYPGLPYGSEYEWYCSVSQNAFNFPFADLWYAYEVYANPNWNFETFDVDVDVPYADKLLASTLNAWSPNLDKFRAAGGKLIISQGQSDAIVVPLNTIGYYDTVTSRFGKKTEGFVRLFMEPGVGHCAPAPGPGSWDALGTIVSWVQGGIAPALIPAYQYDQNGNVIRSRPLCPYPQQAIYNGSGDINEYQNFHCGIYNGQTAQVSKSARLE